MNPVLQDIAPHFDNAVSRGDLLGADSYTVKNSLAAPHPALCIDVMESLLVSLVSRIRQKAIGLRQDGRPQKFAIEFKSRTGCKTDCAENAVDIGVNGFSFMLSHEALFAGWPGFPVKIRLDLPIVVKETGEIDGEVSHDGKKRERLDENRFPQQALHLGPAGQDVPAVHPHGTGATDSTTARIAERKGAVLFVLNPEKEFEEIHAFAISDFKGLDPLGRISFCLETSNA